MKIKKPIIYLYPPQKVKVNVKIKTPEILTHTYPKYGNQGWNVIAYPDGRLTDLLTNREYYCLYWEGYNNFKSDMSKGFVIKGSDTIKFLEENLKLLGLTDREANEFIIYWLPKMENNKYNWIYFKTVNELNLEVPLEINPKPDSLIRVLMEFKPLDKPIKVQEQKIITPNRTGFTVVEWGGTER